jgi:DNA-binding phage protein
MPMSASKIGRAVDRVKRADEAAAEARQALRQLMRGEIAAGRTTKSQIARDLGVSRQRIQKMLED